MTLIEEILNKYKVFNWKALSNAGNDLGNPNLPQKASVKQFKKLRKTWWREVKALVRVKNKPVSFCAYS